MINEQLIKQIVDTYDLPPRIMERIIQIATRNINDFHIDGFDNVYTYIAELIEKFGVAHSTRAFKSLDSRISHDSEDTLYSILGIEDKTLESLFEEQQKLSAQDVLDILKEKIDQHHFNALQHLIYRENNETLLNLSPHEIEDNIEEIQHNLEELLQKYGRGERLILPQKTIIEVKFDPLKIKFGKRFYNGNPLAFFQEHYNGLGRGELSLVDPGLYMSLRRYHQLDKAIPLKRYTHGLPLTSDQINKIIESHPTFKGHLREAARHLPHDMATIIKYWKRAGLEIKLGEGGRKPLPHDQRQEIVSLFLNVRNIKEVKRQTHHTKRTILKYLEENGIDFKQYSQHKNSTRRNLRENKHGSLRWNSSPLDYFKANREKYYGLGRTQLSRSDRGLYRALLRAHQMDEAIPKRENKHGSLRWNSSPLDYFKANREKYYGLGRTQLSRSDRGLYRALLRAHQMDEAIPKSQNKRKPRRFQGNPLAYFRQNEEVYKGITRTELKRFDQVLYLALHNTNQLDQAIPKTAFRGYSTPLDYAHANSNQYKNLTKTQLRKKDRKLYRALQRLGQLDAIVSPPTLLYRGHKTPLDYFREHFQEYRGIKRGQLSLADSGLYRSLVRYGQLDEAIPLYAGSTQRD